MTKIHGSPKATGQDVTEYRAPHADHTPLSQASPLTSLPDVADADLKVIRRTLLGGLIHEYGQVA
jgi:hypothetical protein